MEDYREEIIEIFPIKWILFSKKYFLKIIIFIILVPIVTILGIIRFNDNYIGQIFFIILFTLYNILFVYLYTDRYRTPILLCENYISPSENKLKVSILGKRQSINFDDIEKINNIEKWHDFLKFTVYIRNGKKIELYVDELEDAELIKNTYMKFKERN